jgi:hypothetical protein
VAHPLGQVAQCARKVHVPQEQSSKLRREFTPSQQKKVPVERHGKTGAMSYSKIASIFDHTARNSSIIKSNYQQYRGTLQSGIEQNIFQFSTVTADARQFQIIKGQFKDLPYRERQKRGLILDPANINWQCNNSQHKGEAQVLLEYPIVLTEFGFEKLFEPPAPPPYPSDTTYGAIIDPSVGPYEKKYPISRKIAPGDVERFHIMVGSSMSCHLQVRFKFFIDQTTVIESEI